MTFNKAQEYAAKLDAHGLKDWRMPTDAELKLLYDNRAAIAGFNVTGSYPAGWYWSDAESNAWDGWGRRFSDGCHSTYSKDRGSTVRCLRTDASNHQSNVVPLRRRSR